MMRWLTWLVMLVVASPAAASTVRLPPDPAVAIANADVVAIGIVSSVAPRPNETVIEIDVEEVKRGETSSRMTLTELGGASSSGMVVLLGSPRYAVGDRVLVLAVKRPDGTLQTHLMDAGRIPLERPWWSLGMGGLRAAPSSAGGAALSAWRAGVADAALALPSATPGESTRIATALPSSVAAAPVAFRFMGGKWLSPASIVFDQAGDPAIPGDEAGMLLRAFGAWPATAAVPLESDATTGLARGFVCEPGKLLVSFNDPLGQIEPPRGCSGVLAVGGYCANNPKPGEEFGEITAGAVVFADGWDAQCPEFWTEPFVEEVATHEAGHAIGLAHACEGNQPCDAEGQDATLFWMAHFDGRTSTLKTYDIGAVKALYGALATATPAPTSTPTATPPVAPEPTGTPPAPRGCGKQTTAEALVLFGVVAGVFVAGRRR